MGSSYVAVFVGNSLKKETSLRAVSGEDIEEVTKIITIIQNVWYRGPLLPFNKRDLLREHQRCARAPSCGTKVPHVRGIPCLDTKCPKCGANMLPST